MLFSPKHILVPAAVDSEQELMLAEHSVLVASDIAVKFSARLTLLHLAPIPQPGSAGLDLSGGLYRSMGKILKDRLKLGEGKLSELKSLAQDRGVNVSTTILNSLDDTADTIITAVEQLDVDLLVMSSHGRLGLSKLLFGSVASEVVNKASIPVLILHPSANAKPVKK